VTSRQCTGDNGISITLTGERRGKQIAIEITKSGYGLETGTAAELRLALTLTVTDAGFAALTLLLGYLEALAAGRCKRGSRFLNHSPKS